MSLFLDLWKSVIKKVPEGDWYLLILQKPGGDPPGIPTGGNNRDRGREAGKGRFQEPQLKERDGKRGMGGSQE